MPAGGARTVAARLRGYRLPGPPRSTALAYRGLENQPGSQGGSPELTGLRPFQGLPPVTSTRHQTRATVPRPGGCQRTGRPAAGFMPTTLEVMSARPSLSLAA
jgi:hypothetical protein